MKKKIVVFGNNIIAKRLYHESLALGDDFAIEAFCVDKEYLKEDTVFCGKPLISFDQAIKKYQPEQYDMISTVDAPSKFINRVIVYDRLKKNGYYLRNFVSTRADVYDDVVLGENNLLFGTVHIASNCIIGNSNSFDNTVCIGHDTVIGDGNSFVYGCKLTGFITIGNSCFLGVGSIITNYVHIADESLICAGTVVLQDTEAHTKYFGNPAYPLAQFEQGEANIPIIKGKDFYD